MRQRTPRELSADEIVRLVEFVERCRNRERYTYCVLQEAYRKLSYALYGEVPRYPNFIDLNGPEHAKTAAVCAQFVEILDGVLAAHPQNHEAYVKEYQTAFVAMFDAYIANLPSLTPLAP